jgi:hypothetical protein
MAPVYGLFWVLFFAARFLAKRRGKKETVYAVRPPIGRIALVIGMVLTGWSLFSLSDLREPMPRTLIVGLVALALGVAPALAVVVAVPLGLPRMAWALNRIGGGSGGVFELRSSAGLVAARAVLRRPSEHGARFIENYLATCPELGMSGAAATALIASLRGNREQALAIFGLLARMAHAHAFPPALDLSREYLAIDALRRRNWRLLVELGKGPGTFLTDLLGLVARRVLHTGDAPSATRLWHAWVFTPHRRMTWRIVVRAITAPAPAPPAPVAPSLSAYAALLARDPGSVRAEDVEVAVRSLDEIRSFRPWLAVIGQRRLALGIAASVEDIRAETMRAAEQGIAAAILEGGWRAKWIPVGVTGDAVRALVTEERLRLVEGLVAEMARRARERRDLPEPDEWRAWADARRVCDELRADSGSAFGLFEILFQPLTAYAARLTNVRGRRVLAGDIFRYLRDLAREAGAVYAYDLVDRNAKAVQAYRLPREALAEGDPIGSIDRIVKLRDQLVPNVTLFSLVTAGAAIGSVTFAISGAVPMMLGVLLLLWAMVEAVVRARIVECGHSVEGLVLQTHKGRFIAPFEELYGLKAGPGALVRIRLRRTPRWLPRFVITFARSHEDAQSHVARVQSLIRQKLPLALGTSAVVP